VRGVQKCKKWECQGGRDGENLFMKSSRGNDLPVTTTVHSELFLLLECATILCFSAMQGKSIGRLKCFLLNSNAGLSIPNNCTDKHLSNTFKLKVISSANFVYA